MYMYMSLKPNKTEIFIAFVFSEFCAILEKNVLLAWPHLSTNGNNSIHVHVQYSPEYIQYREIIPTAIAINTQQSSFIFQSTCARL